MRIVLDTNVLVSVFLKPESKPARILEKVLAGEITLLADERILSEYGAVLDRPRFELPEAERSEVLAFIAHSAELVSARPLDAEIPDPGDRPFAEVAVAGSADALVTGNKRHYPRRSLGGVPVLDPAGFLSSLGSGSDP